DAGRLQFVDKAVVEVDTLWVRLTCPVGENAWPRNGEPIRASAKLFHQRHIFFVAGVMVVGDGAGVVGLYMPRLVRIGIPDRQALAILVPRTLDLIRRRANAPVKALGEHAAC